jgi:carboxyl-terminal processing protease
VARNFPRHYIVNRALIVGAVLCAALVSGGMLIQGGVFGEAVANTPSEQASPRLLEQVMDRLRYAYIDTLTNEQMLKLAAAGVVAEVDESYSTLLTPERLNRMKASAQRGNAGIGIDADIRDGFAIVVAPIAGSPADSAGIEPGDRILTIDSKSTYRLTLEEVQQALAGPVGSKVRLTVDREQGAPSFTLTRRMIAHHPVRRAEVLPGGPGYVKLAVVGADAAREVRKAVDSLRPSSLVLDLRENPGGTLDAGVAVAELFLDPPQTIAIAKGRAAADNRTFADAAAQPWPSMPVVVLVDSGTASAAEVIAGSLQDNNRAVIVGSPTYGKGNTQTLIPLDGGYALKLTTARWLTPKGRVIERDSTKGGIEPDVIVRPDSVAKRVERVTSSRLSPGSDRALQRAVELLRGVKSPADLRARVPAKKKD